MEYRAYIHVQRPAGITLDESLAVLSALDQRHEELGPVGGGGDEKTAVYVLSADRPTPAEAVAVMVAAVADALDHAGVEGLSQVLVEVERAGPQVATARAASA